MILRGEDWALGSRLTVLEASLTPARGRQHWINAFRTAFSAPRLSFIAFRFRTHVSAVFGTLARFSTALNELTCLRLTAERERLWGGDERQNGGRETIMIKRLLCASLLSTMIGVFFWAQPAPAADIPAVSDKPVKAPKKSIVDVPFFFVNDNRLTYSYIPEATDPGVSKTVKQVYSFTHFDAWAYGTNFFAISMFKSDHRDPANPCPVFATGCAGATDVYALVRSTFGWNEIFDTKAFSIGPLRNISFEVGADAGAANTFFAPATRIGVAGLQFAFDLPYKGFFNVAPLYSKKIDRNGYATCGFVPSPPAVPGIGCLPDGNTEFKGTWAVETNYYMDLGFLPGWLPLSISGRAAWYGPKGPEVGPLSGIAGGTKTVTEFNSEPVRLTLDASKAFSGGNDKYSHLVDVWVAYRYWQNKLGLDHSNSAICTAAPGTCAESSIYSGITVKF